jgi:hypothetical protein
MAVQSEYTEGGRGTSEHRDSRPPQTGVTLEQAQTQITTIGTRLAQAYPETNKEHLVHPDDPKPMTVVREGRLRPEGQLGVWRISVLLFAVVGLVLLIACAKRREPFTRASDSATPRESRCDLQLARVAGA